MTNDPSGRAPRGSGPSAGPATRRGRWFARPRGAWARASALRVGGWTDIHRAMGTVLQPELLGPHDRLAAAKARRMARRAARRARPGGRSRDDITQVASQFSYNAFLATVPFLFVLVSIIGLVAEPDTFDEFLADDADNAIPIELRQILRSALSSATANTGQAALFLAIGLVTALYVSANVMGCARRRPRPRPRRGRTGPGRAASSSRWSSPSPPASWSWRPPWRSSAARAWWRAWRRSSSGAGRRTSPAASST